MNVRVAVSEDAPRLAELSGQLGYPAVADEAEQWAAAQGLTEIAVRSNVTRDGSHPFYRHIGFEHVKTQHQYRKQVAP